MIKLINNITQIIILLGCCAISIFILFVLITFIKNVDDLAAITNMYELTCIKCGKTMSIKLADPNYINKKYI